MAGGKQMLRETPMRVSVGMLILFVVVLIAAAFLFDPSFLWAMLVAPAAVLIALALWALWVLAKWLKGQPQLWPYLIILLLVLMAAGVTVWLEPSFWGAVLVAGGVVVGALIAWGVSALVRWDKGPPLTWILGLLFIVAVATGATALELNSEKRPGPQACSHDDYTTPHPPTTDVKAKRAPVAIGADGGVEPNPELMFAFGARSNALIRRQSFKSQEPDDKQGFVLLADVSDEETGEALPLGTINAKLASVPVLDKAVRLSVCIDPVAENGDRLEAGTYSGAVAFGLHTARPQVLGSVPVELTVRDDHKLVVMAAILIGVIAGIVVRASGDIAQATGKPAGQDDATTIKTITVDESLVPPAPQDYFFSLRFLVMLAGGLVGGLLVYGPLYADKPDATIDLFDSLIPLTAAAFTATLAAKSLADLRSPTLDERKKGIAGKPLLAPEVDALEKEENKGEDDAPDPKPEGNQTQPARGTQGRNPKKGTDS